MLHGSSSRSAARAAALTLIGAVGLGGTSCSILIDKDADQCEADKDCANFAGTTCQDGVCVAAQCMTITDCSAFPDTICKDSQCVPASEGCAKNAECIASEGDYHICRKDTGTCAALQTKECSTVLGDWKNDDAVIFGALFPLDKDHISTGEALLDSVKLAISDFDQVNDLPPASGKSGQRPIVVVVCSDEADTTVADTSAKHLVDDLGIQAIIGPAFSGITIGVATDVTVNAGTLLFSPSATSTAITNLKDNGLVWRTSPSDVYQAAALKFYVPEIETKVRTELSLSATDKVKLAVLYKGDAYGKGLADALVPVNGKKLQLNGADVTKPLNDQSYTKLDYGNPDDPKTDPDKTSQTVAAMLTFHPNIVLVFGTEEGVKEIFGPIESQWSGSSPRPKWVFSDGGEIKELWDTFITSDDLRQRVTGTAPGTNNQLFLNFRSAFNATYGSDASPDNFGTAGSYDILYLLAYSTVALDNQPLTGANYNKALQMFFTSGNTVNVSDDITGTFQKLSQGNAINFDGASGHLAFDTKTGEAPSDIQIWCVPRDSQGNPTSAINSGEYYSADADMPVGHISPDDCGTD